MKDSKLNSVETIKKLKQELNEALDEKIRLLMLEDALNNISSMTFMQARTLFESISDKLYATNSGRKKIGEYIKLFKESKELSGLYELTDGIIKSENIGNEERFVNESINLISELKGSKLNESMKKLNKLVNESAKLCILDSNDIEKIKKEETPLYESLNYIIENVKTPKNVSEYAKHIDVICEHVKSNKKVIEESSINGSIDSLNDAIGTDRELWESNAMKDIVLSIMSGSDKKELFESYKNDCLDKIDECIEDSDELEMKSRLSLMKEQLSCKQYNESTFNEDILKMSELSSTIDK